jgi:alanine transaminase
MGEYLCIPINHRLTTERDGYDSDPENIFLTAGASQGVQFILQCLIQSPKVGVMIPIPQYPLYTATLALCNGRPVPYYLDEQSGWGLSVKELERSLAEARKQGTDVRALCVINPGNPTGNCLDESNIRDIIQFCVDKRLVLLADEVYQTNTYRSEQKPFHSFKRVVKRYNLA